MKILLLGEFSGFHSNLAAGLMALGHEVTVASSGDGFKSIISDIKIPALAADSFLSKTRYRASLIGFFEKFYGFDVVQIISASLFPASFFPYEKIFERLKSKNKSVFLAAAGSDYFYWTKGRAALSYGPFDDELSIDLGGQSSPYLRKDSAIRDAFIANAVDGIIPITYEYAISYAGFKNLRTGIPPPIDVAQIRPSIIDAGKVRIFHGMTRPGFKGTRHVQKAFEIIRKNHTNSVECIIKGPMRLEDYLNFLPSVDLVVDQVYSYSYGMNALYAMALGKVVLSGAEPEARKFVGVETMPIINALPDAEKIAESILAITGCRSSLVKLAKSSREFVETVHDSKLVASRFVDEWSKPKT